MSIIMLHHPWCPLGEKILLKQTIDNEHDSTIDAIKSVKVKSKFSKLTDSLFEIID